MTFAAFDFLAGIKAAWAAGLGGLDRLAVDHTGRRAGLAALRPAGAPQENVVEPQPHLTGAPGIEVALHRSVGRKLLGQQTPLAAGLGQIERISHRPPHVLASCLAGRAWALGEAQLLSSTTRRRSYRLHNAARPADTSPE